MSLVVKLALIGLSFLLWLQLGLDALVAKVSAVLLVVLVTVVLYTDGVSKMRRGMRRR